MPPAVIAAVATIAVKVFVASKILAAILLVAISVAANALSKKPSRSYNQGQEIRLKLDPSMPRQIALGVTGTGGSLVWAFTYTDSTKKPNRYLVRIIQLSDLPIHSVISIKEGKESLTFAGGDFYSGFVACDQHRTKKGAAAMWMRVYKGSPTAVADTDLISWSGGRWTSTHKGVNAAYVIVKYDNDPDAFPSGEPQLTFGLQGAHLYDERLDSTVGGSGSHRLDDPATWEFTSNATVITSNVLRGLFSAGVMLYGAQAEARDLDTQMLFSAHNTCAQLVDTSIGPVPRYQAGLMATSSDATSVALLDLQAAFDGRIIDRGGSITLLPGAARTPVFNLNDDDIAWSEQKSWQPRATLSEIVNSVTGTYVESQEGFVEKPFPPIRNAAWEAEDGGERFTTNIAFRAVFEREQAQRITKRVGDAGRYQGTVAFVLPIWALEIEQGDWFTLTSARWNLTAKYFEAATVDIIMGDSLMIAVTGREVSPSFSSWDYAVDEKPRGDTQWNSPSYDLVNPEFSVSQYHLLDAASYHELFGLNVQLYNIPDGFSAKQIEIEVAYAVDKANPWKAGIVSAQNQIYTVTSLQPSTNYSVRIRATDGQRYADFSSWVDIATAASTNPLPADVSALETDTATALAAIATAQSDITALEADVATAEADIIAAQGDISTLYTTTSTQGAAITTNATAISNTAGNLANLTTEVRIGSPNLLPNGGFENGLVGWTQSVGVWGWADPTTAVFGTHLYCINTDNGGTLPAGPYITGDWMPVNPGLEYTLSADIRTSFLTGGSAWMDVLFYASDKTTLIQDGADYSYASYTQFYPVGPGRAVHKTTYTCPAGAAFARVRFGGSGLVGTQIAVRQLKFELGAIATNFTDETSVVQSFKAIQTNSTSLASLTTTVATQGASITTNATAITTTNTNLANLTVELRAGKATYLNDNADFARYTTTPGEPSSWVAWDYTGNGGAPARVTGEMPNTYAVQESTTAGNNQGSQQTEAQCAALGGIKQNDYFVVEAFVNLVSGTLRGAAVHIQYRDSGNAVVGSDTLNFVTDPDSTGVAPGAGTASVTYRFYKLVQANIAGAENIVLHRMTGWTGAGTVDAKTLKWYRCGIRPATQEEIATGVALPALEATVSSQATTLSSHTASIATLDTTVSTQGATISSHTSSITTLNGNIATAFARVALTLDVNGNITGYEINNNGTTSNFKIRADQFTIANGSGTPFEVIGSQIRMKNVLIGNAQIDLLSVGTGNIQNNAVTLTSFAFTPAVTGSGLSTWNIIQSLTVPTTLLTDIVKLVYSFHASFTDPDTPQNFQIRLRRNGTVVLGPFTFGNVLNYSELCAGAFADAPGIGTFTYTLETWQGGNIGDFVSARYLESTVLKK